MTKSKLSWLPQKTFELEFTIPWKQVKKAYDKALEQLAKTAEISGFRKGKVPKKVLEKSIDQGKIYGEVINQLLPVPYVKAISEHQLKPAIAPKVQIIKAEENQAWQFKTTTCELPEVKLGDYQKIAKGATASAKIWTPDKGSPVVTNQSNDKKQKEPTQTQKFNQIAKALLKEIKIDLPDLLTTQESARMLSHLLNQVQKLGLTIEQYAQSLGKTIDQLKKEYRQTAENTLKIELILQKIAKDKNFEVKDEEIDKMINQTGDEKIKQKLNTPQEKAYLASVLRKRQVIDYLISL